jgi:hypothetical protein
MPDNFDKSSFLNRFKQKARAKGFELEPDRSKMAKNIPTLLDLLDAIAEALDELIMKDEDKPGTVKAKNLKIGPSGLQQPAAYKEAAVRSDFATDPRFWTWMESLHAIIRGVYPEPGNGSPDVFATAMKVLLAQKPSSITGKIIEGSETVKITT